MWGSSGRNPDEMKSLAKYSKMPFERITYLADGDETTLRGIRRGIFFLMAFWSGGSVMAFARLTEVLAKLPADVLEFVVVDIDGAGDDLYRLPEFGGVVGGWGEAAWVRDGQVLAVSLGKMNVDCYEPNTLALLAAP
jgi:hypothetical protein